jgi:hypothetical protein
MIFGFNTDIKQGETVYHVQSEARQGERLLQTQVFVRGRCIGKKATPYPLGSSASESQLEQLLREQHKAVSDAARDGRVESVLDKQEAPEVLAAVKEIELKWVNAENVFSDSHLHMQVQVTEGGTSVSGAKLVSRMTQSQKDPVYNEAVTGAEGLGEIKIAAEEGALTETVVLIQANIDGRTATRKFAFRKATA